MVMPIYEYRCPSCDSEFELIQKFFDTIAICPNCNSDNAKRMMSKNSFVLKGSGWARDGYSKKASK